MTAEVREVTPYSSPKTLYKYLSHDGLEKTLMHQSVKLFRPTDFNDPLDMFLQEALGMDEADFAEGLRQAFFEFVSGDIDYTTLRSSDQGLKVILMNKAIKADPNLKEVIRAELLNTPIANIYDLDALAS